jgi:hypothetical protein
METENAREHLDTQIQNAYIVVAKKNKDKTDIKPRQINKTYAKNNSYSNGYDANSH